MKPIEHVWVLSGGESKLIWQAGAAAACIEHGIRVDALVTNSGGTYVGAQIAQGGESDLKKIFTTLSNKQVFSHKLNVWGALGMILRNRDGISNYGPIQKLLDEHVKKAPGFWPREYACCYVDLATKREMYMDNLHPLDRLHKGMKASGGMPLAFQTVMIDGHPCVDGGIRTNSPLGEAIRRWNPKHITIINTAKYEGYDDSEEWMEEYEQSKFKSLTVAKRSIEILMAELMKNDIKTFLERNHNAKEAEEHGYQATTPAGEELRHFDHLLIEPPESLGMKLDFERPELFEAGYNHTKDYLREVA